MVTISADTASVNVTGHPGMVIAGGFAVADPYWDDVSFLIGYDDDPVVDEGPRRIDLTEVGAPTRTVPAVGGAGGAYNQTSTTNYRNWVTADRLLDGTIPGKFYWEFACNAGGPAQFNGYHGVVSRNQLDDPTRTYDSDNNPVSHGSLGYRGSGDTWGNGATLVIGTNLYGAGDVVMIAFEPSTGKFWVGLNGTWEDDPTTDPPTRTSDDAGGDFWPVLQAREPGEGGTLRSVTSQFSYAVPTGCFALGAISEAGPSLEGTYSTTLINGGAEAGDLTGWTGDVVVLTGESGVTPRTGDYMFYGGDSTSFSSMYQDIAIDPAEVSAVDAGGRSALISWWQASSLGSDGAEGIITFYDSFGLPVGQKKSGFNAPDDSLGWVNYTVGGLIPEHTRRVRIQFDMTLFAGVNLNAYVDDIEVTYKDEPPISVAAALTNVVLGTVVGQVSVIGTRYNVVLGMTTDLTVKRNSTFVIVET